MIWRELLGNITFLTNFGPYWSYTVSLSVTTAHSNGHICNENNQSMRQVCSATPTRPLVIFNQSTGVYLRFKKRLGSIGGLEPFHQFSIFRWVPSHLRISTSKHQPDFMFWTKNTQSALTFLVLQVIQHSWVFFHVEFNQRFRKSTYFIL